MEGNEVCQRHFLPVYSQKRSIGKLNYNNDSSMKDVGY